MLWTEAAFSACLAWHWPDHHWQCNWRVAWTSSHTYAGEKWTLRSTIEETIFSHMTRNASVFVKFDTSFRLFFWKLLQFHTSYFRKVVWQHTEGMVRSIIRVLLHIYVAFQQWKNFENPLRTDKVIAMSLVYYFFGTQCTHYTCTFCFMPTAKLTGLCCGWRAVSAAEWTKMTTNGSVRLQDEAMILFIQKQNHLSWGTWFGWEWS